MTRFIKQNDYSMQIKQDIIKLLTANDGNWFNSAPLVRAEQTAISQIRQWIATRYDCDVIFTPDNSEEEGGDTRNQFMVTIVIDIALYHLYSQTGMKDIPEHRQQRYQDALDWLKSVGNGDITADLPLNEDEDANQSGGFLINSDPVESNIW